MDMEPIRLTLKRKEIPLELEGEDGVVRNYFLKELKGVDRDNWQQAMARRMEKGPDGKPSSVKDYKNLISNLLAISVFDDRGVAVPEPLIQQWPTSTQTELFNKALELSALMNKLGEAQEELKKD